jgi:hypothetical protein
MLLEADKPRLLRPAMGRPSDYDSNRGYEIIAIMRKGYSLTTAAAKMCVHRATIYRWAETYPDFCDALRVAKALRVLKWERDLLEAKDAATVRLCMTVLKSADPQEWNKVPHSGHRGYAR